MNGPKRKNGPNEPSVDALLRDRWETIVRRSASATVRRVERRASVERCCVVANRCALAVGLLLIVEFPFVCAALESLNESTAAYCETLALAEEPDAFATNGAFE